jgi:hypothetical protein
VTTQLNEREIGAELPEVSPMKAFAYRLAGRGRIWNRPLNAPSCARSTRPRPAFFLIRAANANKTKDDGKKSKDDQKEASGN